jgi:mono/diheme cytochrome c family protein
MKPDPKKSQASISRSASAGKAIRGKSEDSEPSTGHAATPIWFFAGLAILIFWSFLYLDQHAGGFNSKVYGSYTSYADVKNHNPKVEGLFAEGEVVFTQTCVPCHGAAGAGVPGQFPPLAGSEWVLSNEPDRITRIVMNGLQGPIQVKGAAFANAMPAFGENLSDRQIAAVLTYIRASFGNSAPEVPVAKVTEVRNEVKGHSQQWTADELKKVPGAP